MKRKMIIIISSIMLIIVLVVGIKVGDVYLHRMEPEEGCYYLVDDKKYPDACLQIDNGKGMFSDIDLNEIFRMEFAESYIQALENKNGKMSDEEKKDIIESIDLNKQFCKEFEMDYESFCMQMGENSWSYRMGCVAPNRYLGYIYDKEEKTILLEYGSVRILFKKS